MYHVTVWFKFSTRQITLIIRFDELDDLLILLDQSDIIKGYKISDGFSNHSRSTIDL